jgi:hypothetical protein
LTAWKRANSHKQYTDLDVNIRQDIRGQALQEQFYLCAYCCQRIQDIRVCHNEHIEAQKVLNLGDHEKNNRALIEKRKQLSSALIWANGIDPNGGLEDEELLKMLIDDLSQPPRGPLEPFAPVVLNILQSWLEP